MKRFTTVLLLILSLSGFSQKASPYISNYTVPDSLQQEIWSIAQSPSGMMFFAGSRGLLLFDGKQWQRIVLSAMPTSIAANTEKDELWVGSKNDIGVLQRNSFGGYSYKSLGGKKESAFSIETIIEVGQNVYFVAEQQVFVYNRASHSAIGTVTTKSQITAAFNLGNTLGINLETEGLQSIDGTKQQAIDAQIGQDAIITAARLNDKSIILGLASNSLRIFDGKSSKAFVPAINTFLTENILHDIAIDQNGNLIISTLIGGIAIVNIKTETVTSIINYDNGLPDNEIYALALDKSKGIWVAHDKGVSRIDINLPVKRYDFFQGLEGIILATAKFNNVLYVATNEGVFYLTQTQIKREVEIATPEEVVRYETVKKEVEKSTRSFLMFHKREKVEQTETKEVRKTVIKKKKVIKLEPGGWAYKKVEGISGKCKQLVVTGYGLLAASNNGVYEIVGTTAKTILAGKYINQIESSEFHAHYYCLTEEGIFLLKSNNGVWSLSPVFSKITQKISSLAEVSDNTLWLTSSNTAFQVVCTEKDTAVKSFVVGTRFYPHVLVRLLGKTPFFIADNDLFQFNGTSIETYKNTNGTAEKAIAAGLAVWLKQNGSWVYFEGTKQDTCNAIGLFSSIKSIFTDADGLVWVVDAKKGLFCVDKKAKIKHQTASLQIMAQSTGNNTALALGDIELPALSNNLDVLYSLPTFLQTDVEYQYFIDGISAEWTGWQSNGQLKLPFLPHGSYTIHLRARDGIGQNSEELSFSVNVATPFTETIWFYLIIIAGLVIGGLLFTKWRVQKLKRDNEILETKVKERTKTIEEQKEEITTQLEEILQNKEEIETQRDEIEAQRDTIIEQNEEIVQSITYARRIQHAVMPTGDWLKTFMNDYFILFEPRDIVSGDFYWMVQLDRKVIIAAADCTGHGVPGAFMSMLGVSFMNEIVLKNQLTKSDEIANKLRQTVIDTLTQTENNQHAKDGMDMALCVFDFDTNTVQFTGAYNPLLLIRNGELTEFAANRMPIGRFEKNDPFTTQEISFKKGDQFYLFSDGFEDQFGGESDKKLKKVRFKEWLIKYSTLPLLQQKTSLLKEFDQWKGTTPQTDDVLVIGLKI